MRLTYHLQKETNKRWTVKSESGRNKRKLNLTRLRGADTALACWVYNENWCKYFTSSKIDFLALSLACDYKSAFYSNDIRYIDFNFSYVTDNF